MISCNELAITIRHVEVMAPIFLNLPSENVKVVQLAHKKLGKCLSEDFMTTVLKNSPIGSTIGYANSMYVIRKIEEDGWSLVHKPPKQENVTVEDNF